MKGYRFGKYIERDDGKTPFEKLLNLFMQLLVYTSGDVEEALNWLNELDREHKLTDDKYTMADFIRDLKEKGYIGDGDGNSGFILTAKSEQTIRKSALEEVFGKLKKAPRGNHRTNFTGTGDELTSDHREYRFGDSLDQLSMTDSIRNAQINHGINDFYIDGK